MYIAKQRRALQGARRLFCGDSLAFRMGCRCHHRKSPRERAGAWPEEELGVTETFLG